MTRFALVPLVCTRCWLAQRVPMAPSGEVYPNCVNCGPTDWMHSPWAERRDLPSDLRPLPCGHLPLEHDIMRRDAHALMDVYDGERSPEDLTPQQRRYLDRLLDRDPTSPERQDWWYDS